MTQVVLQLGLPEALRPAAVALYWQAFGPKLGWVLGPEPRALAFVSRVMRTDQMISAVTADGQLLGLAGFRTDEGGFASGGPDDLRAVYGLLGGLWRRALLMRLSDGAEDSGFLLDGICVVPAARGHGLGAALIDTLCAEARLRGHSSIRLDVIDTNTRAIALYRRLGFEVTARHSIGPLRLAFGFNAALTMERQI